jgi:hypothetical protein
MLPPQINRIFYDMLYFMTKIKLNAIGLEPVLSVIPALSRNPGDVENLEKQCI